MFRATAMRLRILYRAWLLRLRVHPVQTAYLLENLRAGEVAVDVGSHEGGFCYWMRKRVGPKGKVYAFEADPRSAQYEREIVRWLGFDNLVIEEKTLSLRPSGAESSTVASETIDDYFARASRPVSLIKINAEGQVLEILRGGHRILTEDRPHLVFQCDRRHHGGDSIRPVFDLLQAKGYTGWFFLGNRQVDLTEFDEDLHQQLGATPYVSNFVFKHPDRRP